MTKRDLESVVQPIRFWVSPEFCSRFRTGIMCLHSLLKNALLLTFNEDSETMPELFSL